MQTTTMQRRLSTRKATALDIPPINAIFEDYKGRFLNDYENHHWQIIRDSIQEGEAITIEAEGYPVGFVWFGHQQDDISAFLYFVCRPEYLLSLRKQGLVEQLIDKAFFLLDVKKLKTQLHEGQHGAIYLLDKVLRFKQCGRHKNETRFHDELVWVYDYELHRTFWEKRRRKVGGEDCPIHEEPKEA